MYRDAGQFQSFDGKDNRREVMILLTRLGGSLPAPLADRRRADFLTRLIAHSGNGFARAMCRIEPCGVVDAYFAFVAITGVLGVPVEQAAQLLEAEVRNHERNATGLPLLLQGHGELRAL